jgi:hypothetical protein
MIEDDDFVCPSDFLQQILDLLVILRLDFLVVCKVFLCGSGFYDLESAGVKSELAFVTTDIVDGGNVSDVAVIALWSLMFLVHVIVGLGAIQRERVEEIEFGEDRILGSGLRLSLGCRHGS